MKTVPEILRADADKYEAKAHDYAPSPDDPFENFTFSGHFAERLMRDQFAVVMPVARRQQLFACCLLIGVKISRLMTLGLFGNAKNESVLDTIRDLRVYLGILEAMLLDWMEPKLGAQPCVSDGHVWGVSGATIKRGDHVGFGPDGKLYPTVLRDSL